MIPKFVLQPVILLLLGQLEFAASLTLGRNVTRKYRKKERVKIWLLSFKVTFSYTWLWQLFGRKVIRFITSLSRTQQRIKQDHRNLVSTLRWGGNRVTMKEEMEEAKALGWIWWGGGQNEITQTEEGSEHLTWRQHCTMAVHAVPCSEVLGWGAEI